ncbi:hypothetical protein CRYUN_Cryun10bG0008700 [Craigia yunnanensis]
MEPKNNKILLVFLFWCIILFNSARAICVPRNQSDQELPLSHFSPSNLQPPPSPVSTPISQPPPSNPHPSTASASVPPTPPQETPDSSSEPLSLKSKVPAIQISLPTVSLNVGVGVKTVSDPRIKSMCDKTDQPALCLASIAPFFNGKSDLPSIIEMLIKAGTEQTKQAIATAAKMATDPKSDPKTVSRLNDCKEIYDDALDSMQEAIDAIPLKDVGTVATMVSAAISYYGTCDDGFTGQPNPIPEGVSPMVKINENLINIAGIILALTNMIP